MLLGLRQGNGTVVGSGWSGGLFGWSIQLGRTAGVLDAALSQVLLA